MNKIWTLKVIEMYIWKRLLGASYYTMMIKSNEKDMDAQSLKGNLNDNEQEIRLSEETKRYVISSYLILSFSKYLFIDLFYF